MTSVIIRWAVLLRTLFRGLAQDEDFRALSAAVAVLIAVATLFYSVSQGWDLIDSFYFSVMTLTTIGYGDLTPSGDGAKLFTVAFALSGIGLLVSFVAEIGRRTVADRKRRHRRGGKGRRRRRRARRDAGGPAAEDG